MNNAPAHTWFGMNFFGRRVGMIFPAICLLLASRSFAAPPAVEQAGIEFSLVGLGALPSTLSFRDKSQVVTAEVPTSGRGSPIRYTGSSPLVLFTEKAGADGKSVRVPVATITFSSNWTKVLAVLISGGKPDAPVKALAFDDSPAGFPVDCARLFNFYPAALAVNNADKVEQVASGDSTLVHLQNRGGRTWMQIAARKGDAWEQLPTYVTQITPGMRLLVFAYEQRTATGTTEAVYRTINEAPPPETVVMR